MVPALCQIAEVDRLEIVVFDGGSETFPLLTAAFGLLDGLPALPAGPTGRNGRSSGTRDYLSMIVKGFFLLCQLLPTVVYFDRLRSTCPGG
jgi:hypothetical protein